LRISSRYPLSDHSSIAETNQCIAASLFWGHSSGNVVRNAHFQMRSEFTIDFLLHFRTAE
jgi:hypothetical protein